LGSQDTNQFDIAIIKLAKTIEFNEFIKPICLPFDTNISTNFGTAIVTGFGRTENQDMSEKLLKTEIDIMNHAECVRKYRIQGRSIHNVQICASRYGQDSW
jgi:hypothetical protein